MFPRVLGIRESRQSLEVKVFAPRKQRLAVRSAEIAVSTAFAPLPYPQPRLRCTSAPASGTVTANFDRVEKHPTVIEKEAFIGCNSTLIAPVTVGQGAYIGLTGENIDIA